MAACVLGSAMTGCILGCAMLMLGGYGSGQLAVGGFRS